MSGSVPGTLIVFCGKMAAGKSTLARELAARDDAVLLVQDEFLAALFPGEIVDVPADGTEVRLELHYIEASDALCKRQLKQRSAHLPAGTAWTSDAEFDAITAYFQPPADDEAFTVIRHPRD
jgi:hypothetical protein